MKFRLNLILSAIGIAGLSACVAYPEPPPARSIVYGSYSCDGSRQFVAEFQKEHTQVALMMDDRTRILPIRPDGVYSDDSWSLTGSESTPITIYDDGIPVMENCVPVTTQKQYYRKDTKFRLFDPQRDLN